MQHTSRKCHTLVFDTNLTEPDKNHHVKAGTNRKTINRSRKYSIICTFLALWISRWPQNSGRLNTVPVLDGCVRIEQGACPVGFGSVAWRTVCKTGQFPLRFGTRQRYTTLLVQYCTPSILFFNWYHWFFFLYLSAHFIQNIYLNI
jgi:hypothetical protein